MKLALPKGFSMDNTLLIAGGILVGIFGINYIMNRGGGAAVVPVASEDAGAPEMKFAGTGAGKLFPHMAYLNTLPTQINYPPSTALIYRLQTLNGLADMWQEGTFGPPLNP